ncbi:hypothetical protein CAK78_03095 [Aeromonas sp. A35_P]|nr:hypothetical protein CAK78_03095 [Aeromonas sp. A35_P]
MADSLPICLPAGVKHIHPTSTSTYRLISSSVHPFISSSVHQFISSSVHQFISSSVHQFISSSVHQFISSSVHQFISSSVHCHKTPLKPEMSDKMTNVTRSVPSPSGRGPG